jgi:hypothetical protein
MTPGVGLWLSLVAAGGIVLGGLLRMPGKSI